MQLMSGTRTEISIFDNLPSDVTMTEKLDEETRAQIYAFVSKASEVTRPQLAKFKNVLLQCETVSEVKEVIDCLRYQPKSQSAMELKLRSLKRGGDGAQENSVESEVPEWGG
eukprot:g1458.t1